MLRELLTTPSSVRWSGENDTHHRIVGFLPWVVMETLGWFVGLLVDGLAHGFQRGRNLWL